jgi:hypothetical protein
VIIDTTNTAPASDVENLRNFCSGSKADTCTAKTNVCFTPTSSTSLAGFPGRFPKFNKRLPIHNRGNDSRQNQRCDHHLNDYEIGRVSTDDPTRDNATNIQERVSGPTEPIEHGSLPSNFCRL